MKKILLFILLLIPITVFGKIIYTYNEAVTYTNTYITNFEDNDKYILQSNMPFICDNGSCSIDSTFIKGGFLNIYEYLVIGGKDSYLSDGQTYYTHKRSGNYYYITPNDTTGYATTSSSASNIGMRISEYINSKSKIKGIGTKENPWVFDGLTDSIPPYVALSSQSDATYRETRSITVTVTDGESGIPSGQNLLYRWQSSPTCSTNTADYSSISLTSVNGNKVNATVPSASSLTGDYYLCIKDGVIDNAGNKTVTVKGGIYKFDNSAPDPNMTIAINYNRATLSFSGTDTGSGIKEYYYAKVNSNSCSGAVYSLVSGNSKIVDNLSNGYAYICYYAKDRFGHQSSPEIASAYAYVANYPYRNYSQSWSTPKNGTYKIEAWGASSWGAKNGAYTSGLISLTAGQALYVHVGQTSTFYWEDVNYGGASGYTTGSYNGGGLGGYASNGWGTCCAYRFPSGNGASDVRTLNTSWNNASGLRSRIMVAAGAGGAGSADSPSSAASFPGGAAGGLTGYAATRYTYGVHGTGASQTGPGRANSAGGFGYGGNGSVGTYWYLNCNESTGGGGGYYGGGGAYSNGVNCSGSHGFGGGGSSFISGHAGCNAVNSGGAHTGQPNHFSGLVFRDTVMIDGLGYKWTTGRTSRVAMPAYNNYFGTYAVGVGHDNNGYVRISYVGN